MELTGLKDSIRIKSNSIRIKCTVFTGKDGEYSVFISPSLNVSGYGLTEDEAKQSFEENIELFCQDLLKLSKTQMQEQLYNLGFKRERFNHKNFSKLFVDETGVLQNLERSSLSSLQYEVC